MKTKTLSLGSKIPFIVKKEPVTMKLVNVMECR